MREILRSFRLVVTPAVLILFASTFLLAQEETGPAEADSEPPVSVVAPGPILDEGGEIPCDGWYDIGCCDPPWTVDAGAIYLHRSSVDQTLVVDAVTEQELLNASDLDFDWAAGPWIDVTRRLDSGLELQAVYFGIDGWAEEASATDTGNLKVPIFVDNNFVVDDIDARYGSDLYSLELNVRWPWGCLRPLLDMVSCRELGPCPRCNSCKPRPCVTAFAGFRWIELRENAFFWTSFTEVIDPFVWGTFDVDNHLHGFQAGADAVLWDRGGPFTVDGFAKVGIFGNRVNRSAFASGDLGNRGFGDNGEHTAFLGEMAVKGNYRLTRRLSAVGGFELLWIDGVALAPIQKLAPMSATGTIVYGTAFYYGIFAGVEGRW